MKARQPGQPLYNFADFDVSEIGRFPDALQDLYHRRIDGLIVRNGNQFLHQLKEFRHLWTLVQLEDQLSYFMPLPTPYWS